LLTTGRRGGWTSSLARNAIHVDRGRVGIGGQPDDNRIEGPLVVLSMGDSEEAGCINRVVGLDGGVNQVAWEALAKGNGARGVVYENVKSNMGPSPLGQ
jgi:hypothetical protein